MDLAELGIVATPKGVTESSDQLDKLTGSAGRAEDSVTRFNSKAGDGASATSVMNREVGMAEGAFGLTTTAILGAVAALAAFVAGALSLEKFVSATADAERGQAQLEAALKSTKGVSGQTIESLNAHAEALQALTTYEDDAINKSQALLLTFTKIGGEIFPQATEAIADLAARMGGDLQGATIQIGKALNDPIKGVSALGRAGVQFTEDQKSMIASLVETNDLVGAQTIILKELETQFGGSAEAARNNLGGAIDALTNIFGNLFEVSGPVVEELRLAIESLITAISTPAFKDFANTIGTILLTGLKLAVEAFAALATGVGEFWDYAGPFIKEFGTLLYNTASVILPAVWEAFTTLWDVVKPIIQYFLEGWKQVYDVIAALLGLQDQVKVPDTATAAAMTPPPTVLPPPAVNDAADKLKKGLVDGGNTASATMNKAATTAGATVASTAAEAAKVGAGALANSFGEGASSIAGAGTESADNMAAAIEANGNIMAAKFEGTGRNIYDLFNNWGDSFINSFGVSIGDLLIQFQRAQTAQLNAQAALLAAQARLTEEQAKYLRDNGEMPGTAGSGGGSGDGGGKGSTGHFGFSDTLNDILNGGDGNDRRSRRRQGSSDNDNGKDRDKHRNRLDERGNVPLKIINQMDPREQLDNIQTARGERVIMNVIANKRRAIKAVLGNGG